jgi:hypothetical protein
MASFMMIKSAAPTIGPKKNRVPPKMLIRIGSADTVKYNDAGETIPSKTVKRAPARPANNPEMVKLRS